MDFRILLDTFVERNIGTFNETVWAYMKDSAVWDDVAYFLPAKENERAGTFYNPPTELAVPKIPQNLCVWLVTFKTNLLIYHDCQNTFSAATVSVISYALLVLKAYVSVTLIKRSNFFFLRFSEHVSLSAS